MRRYHREVLNLGAPELLIILFVVGLPLLIIFGIVDAAKRSTRAFDLAGQSKTLWVALLAVGLLATPVGVVLTLVYLLSIRPRVAAAEA